MIHFDPVPKPKEFVELAEIPGAAWLAKNPDAKRPKDLWSQFRGLLADGFHNLCAYSAMFIPGGTVDHFVSCHEDISRAYDWKNYRFASSWVNASKGRVPAAKLLDPFEVEDGWFEVLLPSLQLVVSKRIPAERRAQAEFVLERLHLSHDERVLRPRLEWLRSYEEGELTLEGLRRKAPLIAIAVEARSSAAPKPEGRGRPGCKIG